jgi:hypothetical protein
MNSSLCCALKQAATISFRALALLAVAACCAGTAAADAPEWLRALARQPLPQYPPETKAVVLLDEQISNVKDNGEVHVTYRRAFKILRPDGRNLGTVSVYFDSETRLTFLKGWCIPAQGKDYEVKEKDALEAGISSVSLYDDNRRKILQIPAADPGNVLGYEYEQKQRPNILQDVWLFQDPLPVRLARYSLLLPRAWEFRTIWVNHPKLEPQRLSENSWMWELRELPAIEPEPSMPPWRAVAGWMGLSFYPSGDAQRARSIGSWEELGAWYSKLASGRRDASPEIRAKTKEIIADKAAAVEKIRAIGAFVQRDIRYVSIAIGIGGYQPHAAAEIFANRYGDCKDKVTLMSAMLREAGIESYYVIINATRGVTARDFPSMRNFNHAIIAIRLPDDPGELSTLYSIQEHPRFGKLLFFDPTDSSTPLGYLPPSLQANYGLLVTENSGELLELPLLPPATNRLLRSGRLTLSPNGTLSGKVQEVRWGSHAVDRRGLLLSAQGHERMKVMESILSYSLRSGFTLRSAEADNLENHDDSLILRYAFEAPLYAKTAGNLLLVRLRVLGQKSDDILERKERKTPVEFDQASLESDQYKITLPAGFKVDELPPPVDLDAGFASYRSEIRAEGGVLRYSRVYTVKTVRVPPEQQELLKKFYRAIAADERNTAVLARIFP